MGDMSKAGTMLSVHDAVPLRHVADAGLWAVWAMSDGRFGCYREGKAESTDYTQADAVAGCERRMRQISDILGRTPGAS